METAESLHAFWFGGAADEAATQRQSKLCYGKCAKLDAELAGRLGALVEAARSGEPGASS